MPTYKLPSTMYTLLYYTHKNLFERVRAAAVHLMCVKVIAEK